MQQCGIDFILATEHLSQKDQIPKEKYIDIYKRKNGKRKDKQQNK